MVFAQRGFDGARVDETAERAGINKAMLYYHVGGKERLYAAVLAECIDRALALLRSATATGTPSEKLQAVLDALAEFGTSNPEFIPIVMREVASGGRHLPDEMTLVGALMYVRATDSMRERVAEAAGLPAADHTPADIARHVGNVFLHGLEARPAGETAGGRR